jgi:hypothetical protein
MRSFKAALRAQISVVVMEAVTQAVTQEAAAQDPDSPRR